MSTQLNIFILLFGGLQGLLFSFFIFRKKVYQSGYIYLLFYLAAMLLQITLKVMNKLWLMDNWSVLYSLSHYLPLLYGPFAYLFVRDLVKRRRFNPKSLYHFLPFIFILIIALLSKYETVPAVLGNILYNPLIRFIFLSFILISYHILAYRTWLKHKFYLHTYYSEASRFQMNWLRNFILLSFIVCGLVVISLYLLYIHYPAGHQYRHLFTGLTIFMYWISYTALSQPAIFSVIKGNAEAGDDHFTKMVAYRPVKKYASSTLDAKEKKRICNGLDLIIKRDKIYLDSELTIDRLAQKLACSRHSLSQVLNECIQQSFYDFVNHYRVEEAKMLLLKESRKDHKIASIAYDAGFNSLSTFNDAFRKIAGQTPSQYRKQPQAETSRRQRV